MKLAGKVVVVTGAGNGIGRELTLALLAREARVAAVDVRADSLAALRSTADAGERLSVHVADICDRAAVADLPAAVEAAHGVVDGLINNAGIIQPFVAFAELDDATIERMVDVNLYGTIFMIKAFLPRLLERPVAHVANVSSMGGFFPFPGQTMYGAAKAGVKLLSEGLYVELLDTPVAVSVILPGAIATDIAKNSGVAMAIAGDSKAAARMTLPAAKAAKRMLDGIEADRLHILVGTDAKLMHLLHKLAPKSSARLVRRLMAKMLAPPAAGDAQR